MSLGTITKEINSLKTEVLESMRYADISNQRFTRTSIHMPSQVGAAAPKFNEVLVGLRKEQETIIGELTRGFDRLDIVSIVGMAGLGKTTLATQVYNHPLIKSRFHFRAWCTVSQVYSKEDLLLQIMGDVVSKNPNIYHKMEETNLVEELRKHLMRKRYLIVLDDVWEVDAFESLQQSFPDNKNGSRLLITSRYRNLCSQFKDHKLHLLTDEESWELLQSKVFVKGCRPPSLDIHILGKQIAKHCKGLPLTVVIVAGILANSEQNRWEDVAKSLRTSIKIEKQCKETLELSYQNLPDYLKPCLLYFGAFMEDQDIFVQSLLRLWISEGFVQYNEAKSLEEVADEYLMNLIGRSLVMVTKQKPIGGVKNCLVHDLLHEFCVRKAQEECFLQILDGWNELFASTTLYNPRRLSMHDKKREKLEELSIFFPHLRSLLLFFDRNLLQVNYSDFFQNFKLLRVLDIWIQTPMYYYFPGEVKLLVHLRYLSIGCIPGGIPSGIANPTRLETFRIRGGSIREYIWLPDTVWNMKKLRHLHCRGGFIFRTNNLEVAPDLYNLQTLTLRIDDRLSESLHQILKKLPNICKLKCRCRGRETIWKSRGIDNLDRLESLRINGYFPPEFGFFPLHLKKLTLTLSCKPWSEISVIGKLPNLQVLKLLDYSFVGETWEVKEEEFPKLKFLKLEDLFICKWTFTSSAGDNLPRLENWFRIFVENWKHPFLFR